MGEFGSAALELLDDHSMSDVKVNRLGLHAQFLDHGPVDDLRADHGLNVESIVETTRTLTTGLEPVSESSTNGSDPPLTGHEHFPTTTTDLLNESRRAIPREAALRL